MQGRRACGLYRLPRRLCDAVGGDAGMNQRRPRLHDEAYLAWLRTRRCIACNSAPPCDAAHIREGSERHDKPMTGMGRKPDDKWCLPLCHDCHAAQHRFGTELAWWKIIKLNPFKLAIDYYTQFGGKGGKPKKSKPVKERKPRGQRVKIKGQSAWPKGRGFGR